jgi:hypothetical protein
MNLTEQLRDDDGGPDLPNGWEELPLPAEFIEAYNKMNDSLSAPSPRRFVHEAVGLSVILTRDDLSQDFDHDPDLRWHMSMVGPERVPTWNEMAEACHTLRPGVVFVMGIPPRSWWVNVHDDCLHAREVRDDRLTDAWRSERAGHTPS